ncbi:MAG: methanogenesis marker protein Mmp4/MtxX [Methanomassiliicoccus sp.]|nr:methanogenesis marker protein Mmp4/MtxX [Methanomassiliicoccus sp.]
MRIGIGAGGDQRKAFKSRAEALIEGYGEVTVYDDPLMLAEDLGEGRIDGAVRGDLGSNEAMAAVRSVFGVPKVLRAAFLEPEGGRMFLLAPVGIDEGWTVEEKVELARLSVRTLLPISPRPTVGVMSGGRASDRGRLDAVDRTIDDAEEVVARLVGEGIDARDVQILIENASRECDIVIAPDGISGNLIFRTLHFLGKGKALGAPVLNIDRPYIDTSRAKDGYADSIALAAALAMRNRA